MASGAGWMHGIVKAVPSGDGVLVMGNAGAVRRDRSPIPADRTRPRVPPVDRSRARGRFPIRRDVPRDLTLPSRSLVPRAGRPAPREVDHARVHRRPPSGASETRPKASDRRAGSERTLLRRAPRVHVGKIPDPAPAPDPARRRDRPVAAARATSAAPERDRERRPPARNRADGPNREPTPSPASTHTATSAHFRPKFVQHARSPLFSVFSFSLILAFSLSSHSPHTPLPAPRTRRLQARRDGTSKDEPFAHASRERLRRKLVGKRVTFRVDRASSGAPGAREFGQIYLGDENVALARGRRRLGEGQAGRGRRRRRRLFPFPRRRRPRAPRAARRGGAERRRGRARRARGDPAALARSRRDVPDAFDARAFFASLPGDAAIPGVVEAVLNGGVLRVALHTDSSESRHAVVTAHVAGAQCPSMGKKPAPAVASASRDEREKDDALPASAPPASDVPAAPTPEPFAREAKHFTETRLLHRDVELFYAGEDKYKNAFFSVRVMDEDAGDPAFDPAVALVRAGLARVADWSVALVPSAARALRAAEREAKQQRLRLWRACVPRRRVSAPIPSGAAGGGASGGGGASSRAFIARCVEAASGDAIVVQAADGAERKVHLSSVRAPRMGNARRGVDPEPWAFEAREF